MVRLLAVILFCLTTPGCVAVQLSASNPIRGMTNIAIAPFFNLSQEKAVDGRRFAMAYFAELQKTPGFQVVPVGVVEQAIFDNNLEMIDPSDALELARILDVDAVVVGAVTDYNAYYPPRIGLKVAWYSRENWELLPEVADDTKFDGDAARPEFRQRLSLSRWWRGKQDRNDNPPQGDPLQGESYRDGKKCSHGENCLECEQNTLRGQSPGSGTIGEWRSIGPPTAVDFVNERGDGNLVENDQFLRRAAFWNDSKASALTESLQPASGDAEATTMQTFFKDGIPFDLAESTTESDAPKHAETREPVQLTRPPQGQPAETFNHRQPIAQTLQRDTRKPLMSYTRMFDGADADLVARLRDYVELSGDRRSGGWEAYLHRSEDFIRFTAHLMIVEMLTLHGGEAKRRFVFKLRKHR